MFTGMVRAKAKFDISDPTWMLELELLLFAHVLGEKHLAQHDPLLGRKFERAERLHAVEGGAETLLVDEHERVHKRVLGERYGDVLFAVLAGG